MSHFGHFSFFVFCFKLKCGKNDTSQNIFEPVWQATCKQKTYPIMHALAPDFPSNSLVVDKGVIRLQRLDRAPSIVIFLLLLLL